MDTGKARVRRIFDEAVEVGAAGRAAFLDRACEGDAGLRGEVEALLNSLDDASAFLATSEPLREVAGSRIGPYRLIEEIGEGGFGVVFLAEQEAPVVRCVALKILKPGMDTRQVIARFEAERQALALMDHPGIAKVFDAGATETGRPYFVMELVHGEPIVAYCDRNHLDTSERLELFIEVCRAIQHAHQKGIIHRDIKPSNILVTAVDGRPVPKVIDFGIAKATSAHVPGADGKTLFTRQGQWIGTPEYMSPEQAGTDSADIDTRSDVYSLGVLLYQILTGTTPMDGGKLRSAAWDEVLRLIREGATPKPSTRVSGMEDLAAVAAHRRTEPARLRRLLRGDLDWIALKCLEKERARRYGTASELADDLARHLAGEPVVAAPPSRAYLARKFVRRHRTGVTLGAIVVLAIAAAVAGTAVGLVRESRQRAKAERISEFMQQTLRGTQPSVARGRDTAMLREMMDGAAARIARGDLAEAPEAEVSLRVTIARAYRDIGDYEAATAMIEPALPLAEGLSGRGAALALASALHERGVLHVSLGRPADGEVLLERALAIRREEIRGDDTDVADALLAVVRARKALGRFAEAEPPCREGLAMRERLGETTELAQALRWRSIVLLGLERPSEAEAPARQALEISRRSARGDSVDLVLDLDGLGGVLVALERLDEAEPLLEESLAMSRRIYAGDHPTLASSLGAMAEIHHARGRLDEADALCEQALAMNRRVYGGDHPNVEDRLVQLGAIRTDRGRFAEALAAYEEAVAMHGRYDGGFDGGLALTMNAIAFTLFVSGRPDEAEAKLREILGRVSEAPREQPEIAIRALEGLARIENERGRHAEAEALLLDAWGRGSGVVPGPLKGTILGLVDTYERWERTEPRHGHAEQAASWLARLPPR